MIKIGEKLRGLVSTHQSELQKIGFELDLLGDQDLTVRAVPEVVATGHIEKALWACCDHFEREVPGDFAFLAEFGDETPLKQLDPFRVEPLLRDLQPNDDFCAEISFESLNQLWKKGKAP